MREKILAIVLLGCFIFPLPSRLNAVCDQAWVGDNSENVVVISTETQTQTSVFQPGDDVASGIAFTPDGAQVFLTDPDLGVWAIDASTHASTQISTERFCNDIVVSPNGQFAYVAIGDQFAATGAILQINTATHVVTTLNSAPYSVVLSGIAISPDGSILYAVGSPVGTNQALLVIDASNGNVLQTIMNPSFFSLFKIAITPDGAFAYITDQGGSVFQINTTNFSVAAVSTGTFIPFSEPWDVVIHPNGQFAYVTDASRWIVYVIQISSNTVVNAVSDPNMQEPEGIAITPDGNFLYVANFGSPSNIVTAINTSTFATHDIVTSAFQSTVVAISPPCVGSTIKGRIGKNKDFWQTNIFSQLCWDAPPAFTPSRYYIFRNGKKVGAIPGNQTFFNENYLKPDKTYSYSIFAVNPAGAQFLVGTIVLKTE